MLPKLEMLQPCSNYRYDGITHGCEELGECKPIQMGPDLSVCTRFHTHAKPVKRQAAKASELEVTSRPACVHLGQWTGELLKCDTCADKSKAKVITCAVHGQCTIGVTVNGKVKGKVNALTCCEECKDHQEKS